jgi:catechol 2,3-dioxygenase-like lactoylglutathione lyase family enzyme
VEWALESPYFHITQVVADLDDAQDVYERLFARPVRNGGVSMGRTALFTRVGDQLLEAMVPGPDARVLLKFVDRYGSHWQSIAWYVRNIDALAGTLLDRGMQLAQTSGTFITEAHVPRQMAPHGSPQGDTWWSAAMWTRLHQTRGFQGMYEFCEAKSRHDLARWRADDPVADDPLTVVRGSHATIVVNSARDASAFWCEVMGARQVALAEHHALGTLSAWCSVGEGPNGPALLEFAEPIASGAAADDRAATDVDILHAYTFLVRDLGAVRAHLAREGFCSAIDEPHLVVTDPTSTAGARYGFIDTDRPVELAGG